MNTYESPEQVAAELAVAFNNTQEKVVIERILDEFGEPSSRFPRYDEILIPKTVEEVASADAMVAFITSKGLLSERPLTFIEILNKIQELGFEIKRTSP